MAVGCPVLKRPLSLVPGNLDMITYQRAQAAYSARVSRGPPGVAVAGATDFVVNMMIAIQGFLGRLVDRVVHKSRPTWRHDGFMAVAWFSVNRSFLSQGGE